MNFSEFQLEEFIWNNISNGTLQKRGLHLPNGIFYRQMHFPSCGIPDLISVGYWTNSRGGERSKILSIDIFELKKGEVHGADMIQLLRYMTYAWSNVRKLQTNWDCPPDFNHCIINGWMIGNSYTRDALCVLSNCDSVSGIEFSFDLEIGVAFNDVISSYTWPHPDTFKQVCAHEKIDFRSIAKTSNVVSRAMQMGKKQIIIENPN